jgi:hypothetical protein
MKGHARFHQLAILPPPELRLELRAHAEPEPARMRVRMEREPAEQAPPHELSVRLHNEGKTLAFFIQLLLVDAAGREVVPTLYSDNYVSLLPGESWDFELSTRRLPAGARVLARSGADGHEVGLPL